MASIKNYKETTSHYLLLDNARGHDFVNNSSILFSGILLQIHNDKSHFSVPQ